MKSNLGTLLCGTYTGFISACTTNPLEIHWLFRARHDGVCACVLPSVENSQSPHPLVRITPTTNSIGVRLFDYPSQKHLSLQTRFLPHLRSVAVSSDVGGWDVPASLPPAASLEWSIAVVCDCRVPARGTKFVRLWEWLEGLPTTIGMETMAPSRAPIGLSSDYLHVSLCVLEERSKACTSWVLMNLIVALPLFCKDRENAPC